MSESAAATTLPEAASLVGTTIAERYKVESVLGEGGMGAVYLVQHTHMRKRYALKVLHPETSKNPELVARFEREAVASAHADHPNITAATDFGRAENGAFYLVLEYLEGRRLRDVLAEGPLPLPRALHIARQVASALGRAHELGIIHRGRTRLHQMAPGPSAGRGWHGARKRRAETARKRPGNDAEMTPPGAPCYSPATRLLGVCVRENIGCEATCRIKTTGQICTISPPQILRRGR
jgi:serine/threonine-protein kinase